MRTFTDRKSVGRRLAQTETVPHRPMVEKMTVLGIELLLSLIHIYIEPSKGIRWQKKAIVLPNRSCYSATNTFVRDMKECPLVTIMGDRTGGGSGLPFSSELPNGWSIRFSACPV